MNLASWLTQHQPHDGYLLGTLRFLERRWDRISLGSVLNRWVKRSFKAEEGKAPRWVSELYGVLCLVVAGTLFFLVPPQARCFWLVLAAWAVYRVVDLLAFVVGWIFVHTDPLHSIQRSLLSFFLNIVELNLLFGFLDLVANGISDASRLQYLVTHLTAFATVSVIEVVGISSVVGVIELVRVFASLLLVLVIVGSLAGGVVRRTTDRAAEGSQGSQQKGPPNPPMQPTDFAGG